MNDNEPLLDLSDEALDKLDEKNEPRIVRDQAYTYFKTAVDEVMDFGKIVFRKNESRLKGYGSDYRRRINKKRAGKTKKDAGE